LLYYASTQIAALLDTGAASSFITSDLADTLHSSTHTADIPIKVKGAFSTSTNTASSIAEMTFTIRGCSQEFTISLYVVDSIGSHKPIIGNPILQQFLKLLTPSIATTVSRLMLFLLLQFPLGLTLINLLSIQFSKNIFLAIADELPTPTSTSAYRHSIELLPDAPLPKSNPFTLSLTEEEEVTTQIDKLLELEHIVPSTSSLASPCFIG